MTFLLLHASLSLHSALSYPWFMILYFLVLVVAIASVSTQFCCCFPFHPSCCFVIPRSGCHWRWRRRRRNRAMQLSKTLSWWYLLYGREMCQFCYANRMRRLLARMSEPTVCSCCSLLLLLSSVIFLYTTHSFLNLIISCATFCNPTLYFPLLSCPAFLVHIKVQASIVC